jgi:NADPH-dependent 7-cyano-7-deazaguanine reductase QueF
MTEKKYGDKSLLEAIPNRITLDKDLLITHTANELTFIGSPDQPDFGQLTILTTPGPGGLIELKSLKKYFNLFASAIFRTNAWRR